MTGLGRWSGSAGTSITFEEQRPSNSFTVHWIRPDSLESTTRQGALSIGWNAGVEQNEHRIAVTPYPAVQVDLDPPPTLGETLNDISKKYYGTVKLHKLIMKANGISDPDRILAGQRLRIPPKPVGTDSGASIVEGAIKPGEQSYVVRSGDTLIAIAMRFYNDARYQELIGKRNGITDPTRVRTGQRLVIPPKPADAESGVSMAGGGLRPGEQSYVVREGDTLIDIARQFYQDARYYDLIMKRNGIADPLDLRAGNAIIIPPLSERSALMETRAAD